jgi:head-tail adaptor
MIKAAKFRHKIEIRAGKQTGSPEGGLTREYTLLAVTWADVKPTSRLLGRASYTREQQTTTEPTHVFTMRRSKDVDFVGDGHLKRENFLFMRTGEQQGRLFKIHSAADPKERGFMVTVLAEEIEEQEGTEFLKSG